MVTATCDIMPPMKDTSFGLILELMGIVDFCCVWGWWCLKHEKVTKGQVGTLSVGLVGSVCHPTPLSVDNLLVNFLPVWSFYLHFKKPNNTYLQE